MHVEMDKDMVDAYSWPEVLVRYIGANCPSELECMEPVQQACAALERGYDACSLEQRYVTAPVLFRKRSPEHCLGALGLGQAGRH